jgi:type I restriction enzyme R subunit
MKGRGTRTLSHDDLLQVTPDAPSAKTHYVIVDAVGVTQSLKTDSRPLERQPGVATKDLLAAITFGARSEDLFTSLAGRLLRLDRQLSPDEKAQAAHLAGGLSLGQMARTLLNAYDPDAIEDQAGLLFNLPPGQAPGPGQRAAAQALLIEEATASFNGDLNDYLENVRRQHEQIIDTTNLDKLEFAGWSGQAAAQAGAIIADFQTFCAIHRDELLALRLFYDQPYHRRALTFQMVKELLALLKAERPALAPAYVWRAYEQLEKVNGRSPKNELIALVSLIRRVTNIDDVLTPYDQTVDRNFKQWVFQKNAGATHFTPAQMAWLRMIKDHIAASIHFDRADLDYAPFDAQGGLGKMWQLFGDDMDTLIGEINEALAA